MPRRASTAIFGEKRDHFVHLFVIRGVIERTAIPPARDQARMLELGQVKRKGGRRQSDPLGYVTRGMAIHAGLDQQAKDREPRFLRQCFQRQNDIVGFHISNNMKQWT